MGLFPMTKTLVNNLVKGPVTERYPHVPKKYPAGARGKVEIEIDKCIYCGICQKRCPTAALTVDKAARTWSIDRLRCIWCNCCVEVCPKKCLALDTGYSPATTARTVDVFTGPPAPPPSAAKTTPASA